MNCDDFSALLDAYLRESLDGPRREAFRAHLGSCDRCRMAAVRTDPTMLFGAAAGGEPDRARIEDLTRSVMAEIRQQRLRQSLHRPRRGWLAAAATVVVSLAAVTGWRLLAPGGGEVSSPFVEAQRVEHVNPPPRAEMDMAGEGVRVYQFTDQPNADTAVYFIVNPAMEL